MNLNEKNYISPAGFKRIVDELNHLVKIDRPEVTKVVTWAAGNGDRSENADYQYGKKRLREIDKRVRFLSSRIDAAVVVNPKDIKSDKVQFGATICLLNIETQIKKTLHIVGVDEVDIEKAYISWKSPIGSAAIGKEVGDSIIVKAPNGQVEYEILEIAYKEIL